MVQRSSVMSATSSPFEDVATESPRLTMLRRWRRLPVPPRRWGPRLGLVAAGVGAAWSYDAAYNDEVITRVCRVAWHAGAIILDYKINFNPDNTDQIHDMHQRVADRMHYVCTKNGGLFIKLGQSIALQASILPKPYRDVFNNLFDQAPTISFEVVEQVLREELGQVDQVFETFEREALASASISQVHLATLRNGGKQVAVKIQKPAIKKQINLDMFSYKALLWISEKLFDLPLYFVADYIAQQIRKETNFLEEARNSERTAQFISNEPTLKDVIIVPKVYWDLTSERVLTTEYMPGCKLTDVDSLQQQNMSIKKVMDHFLNLFGAMIFKWGWLHCDPHPGNLLVRPTPGHSTQPQIILIDHGLYIPLPDEFRKDYCELWKSLFLIDTGTIKKIASKWGIGNSDMFASATLLRPTNLKQTNKSTNQQSQSQYQKELTMKATFKSILENEKLIPRELIFLGRTMRICQANNQTVGSPSNRINIFAHWSSIGLTKTQPSLRTIGVKQWVLRRSEIYVFKLSLLFIDFGFFLSKVRQWWYAKFLGKEEGFEDLLQRQIESLAHREFGIELDDKAFTG